MFCSNVELTTQINADTLIPHLFEIAAQHNDTNGEASLALAGILYRLSPGWEIVFCGKCDPGSALNVLDERSARLRKLFESCMSRLKDNTASTAQLAQLVRLEIWVFFV